MSAAADLHAQIASIVEVLANSAVAEICKVVEDGYAVVNLEVSRGLKENECLRRRVRLLELQVSRYRAEQRLRAPADGAASGRAFPGVRLLQRPGRDTPSGPGLQSRSRLLSKPSVSQPQKATPTNLDQDPDQEVVTTTKTEPTDSEEESDLVIVKVEGSVEDPRVSNDGRSTSAAHAPTGGRTEVSASQTFKTQDGTIPLSQSQQTHGKKSARELPSDVIVIEDTLGQQKEMTSEKPSLNKQSVVDKAWPSFQNPQSPAASRVGEPSRTSSGPASLFVAYNTVPPNQQALMLPTNVTAHHQRFEASGASRGVSGLEPNVTVSGQFDLGLAPPHGGFSGQTFAQRPPGLYPCPKCPQSFHLEADLVKHVAGHRRRKCICGICKKGFVSKSQLEIHQNVHTGQRPFRCSVCLSVFSHPSNLRRHMKIQHQHQ